MGVLINVHSIYYWGLQRNFDYQPQILVWKIKFRSVSLKYDYNLSVTRSSHLTPKLKKDMCTKNNTQPQLENSKSTWETGTD